jgi:hypothetical protein
LTAPSATFKPQSGFLRCKGNNWWRSDVLRLEERLEEAGAENTSRQRRMVAKCIALTQCALSIVDRQNSFRIASSSTISNEG